MPNPKVSTQTQEAAMKVAKATQKPGQTKEQTKLIAQGIERGIEQYKKQQKAKAREFDKQRKRQQKKQIEVENTSQQKEITKEAEVVRSSSVLPWVLLVFSWCVFAAYILFIA